MSDEEQATEWLAAKDAAIEAAAHVRRLRIEYDESIAAAEFAETRDAMARFDAVAKAVLARYESTACNGEIEKVSACSDANAETCPERKDFACPRRLIAERVAEAREERNRKMNTACRYGAPASLVEIAARGLIQTQAVVAVDAMFANDARLLVLAGGVGVGKSLAATHAIYTQGSRSGGLFVYASKLATLNLYHADDRELLQRAQRTSLLVIDDAGSDMGLKGRDEATLDALVVGRFDNKHKTIITTNLGPQEFRATFGERVWDRIRDSGKFVVCGGASMRGGRKLVAT